MARVKTKKNFFACLALVLAAALLLASCVCTPSGKAPVTVTILQTSDIHGMLYPYDYASNAETAYSLAHIASVIEREREADPTLLLIDTGDFAQGNYIHEFRDRSPHPAAAALNALRYDIWTLGNHEFNFEYDYLERAIADFDGTVLLGNAYTPQGDRWQSAYKIFDVKGLRVAVFGLTAPHIPKWEAADSAHFNNMTFSEPIAETGKILDELDGRVDLIIGCIHYGLEGEYGSEGVGAIIEAYSDRLDALLIGHSHERIEKTIRGVPVLAPTSNGEYVGKLTLVLDKVNGEWTVNTQETERRLIDASAYPPCPSFLEAFQPLHSDSLALAASKIGEVGETFLPNTELLPGIPIAIIEDTPLLDLICTVMTDASGADVAHASLFDPSTNLQKGDFLHRDGAKVYKYTNALFVVRLTGMQLKAIMEKYAGSFFNQYNEGDVTVSFNADMRMYEYDTYSGVDYEIDVSRPAGERIVNLMLCGQPLSNDAVLTMALNSYRCGALLDEGLLSREQIVWEGGDIQSMIANYVAKLDGPLMPACDYNWRIVGAPLDDPQKELIYEMVRSGELTVPTSEDGRTPNIAALNGPQLRAEGKLPPL